MEDLAHIHTRTCKHTQTLRHIVLLWHEWDLYKGEFPQSKVTYPAPESYGIYPHPSIHPSKEKDPSTETLQYSLFSLSSEQDNQCVINDAAHTSSNGNYKRTIIPTVFFGACVCVRAGLKGVSGNKDSLQLLRGDLFLDFYSQFPLLQQQKCGRVKANMSFPPPCMKLLFQPLRLIYSRAVLVLQLFSPRRPFIHTDIRRVTQVRCTSTAQGLLLF